MTSGDELAGIDAALDRPGTISGRVTAVGEPAAGVMVTASGPGFVEPVWTGADGTYTVPVVHPGSYTLHFEPESTQLRSEWYDDAEQRGDATGVTVAASGDVTGIDAELDAGGSISGVITDTSGTPIPGARIEVNNGGRWFVTTTDDAGRYTVGGLAGVAIIRVTQPGFVERFWPDAPAAAAAGRVIVESGEALSGYDIAMPAVGTISGTVSAAGAPVEFATVDLLPLADGVGQTVTTDLDGSYRFAGVRPGTYQVRFGDVPELGLVGEFWDNAATDQQARTITVTDGSAVTGVDAALAAAGPCAAGSPTKPVSPSPSLRWRSAAASATTRCSPTATVATRRSCGQAPAPSPPGGPTLSDRVIPTAASCPDWSPSSTSWSPAVRRCAA